MSKKRNTKRVDAIIQKNKYVQGVENKIRDIITERDHYKDRVTQLETALVILADKIGSGHVWYKEIMEVVGGDGDDN